jgi:peptidoglycan/LPS O-acetylase OafA/YrhL
VLAARGKSLAHAALLGTLLIPVAFNPANYYIHFIFALPLLALERPNEAPPLALRDFLICAILLSICVLQYWTVLIKDWELHFQLATVILFFGIAGLLLTMIGFDRRRTPQSSDSGAPASGL